jgi:hypothetical protein
MANTTPNPDIFYLKSREQLLVYEDTRMKGLCQAIANFYITRNDQTKFGEFLRAVAIELARLDYDYAYDLANKNPKYLTPPDIKRRWQSPLFIGSDYPAAGQTDMAYRTLIQNLLLAFQEGPTVQGISDVISAFTQQPSKVQELYKLIGQGYTASDRNTLQVAINLTSDDIGGSVNTINQLQTITNDLYTAINYAKPAHVLINFSTIFAENESMVDIYSTQSDNLILSFQMTEDPASEMLTLAPYLNAGSPDTRISADGQLVGKIFTKLISAATYAALPYAEFKAQYTGPVSGEYTLNINNYTNVALTTGPGITSSAWAALTTQQKAAYTLGADSNYYPLTGVISTAAAILAPNLNTAWEVGSDDLIGLDYD